MALQAAKTYVLVVLCLALAVTVLVLDYLTHDIVAGGLPYLLVVLASGWLRIPRLTWWTAILCSVFAILGTNISEPLWNEYTDLIHRGLTIAAIWITAGMFVSREKADERVRNLAGIIATTDDAIIAEDAHGVITSWNRGAERIYGYSAEDALGCSLSLLVPADKEEEHHEILERLRNGEHFRNHETEQLTRKGQLIDVSLTITPMRNRQGVFTGASVIARDITERKRAEERFHLAVEASPNAIIMVRQDGAITMANSEAEHLFAYERDELIGQPMEMLLPERYRTTHGGMRAIFHKDGRARKLGGEKDFYALNKHGQEVPVEIGLNPIRTEGETLVLCTLVDITERKRAQHAIERERDFTAAVLDTVGALVVVLDRKGRIVRFNCACEEITGYRYEDLKARPVWELLFFEEDVKPLQRLFGDMVRGRFPNRHENYWRTRNGRRILINWSNTALLDEVGNVEFVIATGIDVTEHRQAEKALAEHTIQLEQAIEELRRRNAELDEFTHAASHDLQEPLVKLSTFCNMLRKDLGGELPERAEKDVLFITESSKRMQTLVQDLLQLSRLGRSALKQKEIDLDECANRALEALSSKVVETGAEIRRDPLPRVVGDPTLLVQLYQNLLSNALKYTAGEKPVIHLTASREGGQLVLGVKDSGIGIDPQYSEQIFAPFKRLHGRSEYDGTGIGLALCRKAVERHGGQIWVESSPGQGAHFKFTLQQVRLPSEEAAKVSETETRA